MGQADWISEEEAVWDRCPDVGTGQTLGDSGWLDGGMAMLGAKVSDTE